MSDRAGEQAEHDQRPADELDRAGEIKQPRRHFVDERQTVREAEELAGAVLEKQKAGHDAQHRLQRRSESLRNDGHSRPGAG